MGAGKGKQKRAQSGGKITRVLTVSPKQKSNFIPTAKDAAIICKEKAWQEYVETSGVGERNITGYYLGKIKKDLLTEEEKTQMINELYQDALQIGALRLPPEINNQDFTWQITNSPHNFGYNNLAPLHPLLDDFSTKVFSENYISRRFDHRTKMKDLGIMIHYFARCLSMAMDAKMEDDWRIMLS